MEVDRMVRVSGGSAQCSNLAPTVGFLPESVFSSDSTTFVAPGHAAGYLLETSGTDSVGVGILWPSGAGVGDLTAEMPLKNHP